MMTSNSSAPASQKDDFQSLQIAPADVPALLQKDAQAIIVDVREQCEWDEEHVSNSILLPTSGMRPSDFEKFPKDHPLLIMCAHGNRSFFVTQKLREMGFAQALNMTGGISSIPMDLREKIAKLLEGRNAHA